MGRIGFVYQYSNTVDGKEQEVAGVMGWGPAPALPSAGGRASTKASVENRSSLNFCHSSLNFSSGALDRWQAPWAANILKKWMFGCEGHMVSGVAENRLQGCLRPMTGLRTT